MLFVEVYASAYKFFFSPLFFFPAGAMELSTALSHCQRLDKELIGAIVEKVVSCMSHSNPLHLPQMVEALLTLARHGGATATQRAISGLIGALDFHESTQPTNILCEIESTVLLQISIEAQHNMELGKQVCYASYHFPCFLQYCRVWFLYPSAH